MHTRLKRIAEWASPLILFILSTCVFYHTLLFNQHVILFRDTIALYLPMMSLVRDLMAKEWLPLWNPLMVLGKPLIAEPFAGLLYPPLWIARLFPQPIDCTFAVLSHHVIAATGAFFFARQITKGTGASILAGILYSYGGFLINGDNQWNVLYSLSWVPWSFFAYRRFLTRRSGGGLFVVSASVALTFLGGMPEAILIEAIFFISQSILRKGWLTKIYWFLPLLLGLLLSSALFFPLLEYLKQSTRSDGIDLEGILYYSAQWSDLLRFLFQEKNILWDDRWAVTVYCGPILSLLPLLFVSPVSARTISGIVAVLIAFFLALGSSFPPAHALIASIPFMIARYPEKLLFVVHLLSAVGVAVAFSKAEGRPRLFLIAAGTALVGSSVGALLGYGVSGAMWFLFSLAFASCWWLPRLALLLMPFLLFADLWVAHAHFHPTAPWSFIRSGIINGNVIQSPSKTPANTAANTTLKLRGSEPYPRIFTIGEIVRDGEKIFPYVRDTLLLLEGLTAALYQIDNLNTPSSINLADHLDLVSLLDPARPTIFFPLLHSLGVSALTSTEPLMETRWYSSSKRRSPEGNVWASTARDIAPWAFGATHIKEFSSEAMVVDSLHTEPLEQGEVRIASSVKLKSLGKNESHSVQSLQIEMLENLPSKITMKVSSETPTLLVSNDTYYPGWVAEIDGVPTELFRANHFVRGIEVPSGSHIVTERYFPESFFLGCTLSLLTVAGMLIYIVGAQLYSRTGET